jgi:hypothetical protein
MSAKTWADYCAREMHNCHRGAFSIDGTTVVFGNDGYGTDERSRLVLDLLRQDLDDLQLRELGFAASADGYTWAVLVEGDHAPELFSLVWEVAGIAYGREPAVQIYLSVQEQVAARECLRGGSAP